MKFIKLVFLALYVSSSLRFVASNPSSRRDDLGVGDSCKLNDGSVGTCQLDTDCPYFFDLIQNHPQKQMVSCGFVGIRQIVCCKEQTFSDRFSKVLCEGDLLIRPPKPITFTFNIIRGEKADPGEFPHMAALGYLNEGSQTDVNFRCGGTLISEDFVLTAAHCCNKKGNLPTMVRLGKTSLKDDTDMEQGQDIKIKKIMIHEKYSSRTKLNDIALLQLEKSAVLAHNVFPACVSSDSEDHEIMNKLADSESEIKALTIIGFGRVDNDDYSVSDWLLKANVSSIPLTKCKKEYLEQGLTAMIGESQVCALNSKTFSDTCQGDSGGPMTYSVADRYYLYGITSYGLGCGSVIPSIYTRVDEYLDWLDDKMNS